MLPLLKLDLKPTTHKFKDGREEEEETVTTTTLEDVINQDAEGGVWLRDIQMPMIRDLMLTKNTKEEVLDPIDAMCLAKTTFCEAELYLQVLKASGPEINLSGFNNAAFAQDVLDHPDRGDELFTPWDWIDVVKLMNDGA